MGCDIHLHTEVKIDGTWHHYGAPNIDRSYALFGKMAGVRDRDVGSIADPKGLPDDMSVVTRCEWDDWNLDGHSGSWLNAQEILELENWLKEQMGVNSWKLERTYWGYLFENSWGGFLRHRSGYPDRLEDIRFVFWFDN